VKDFSIFVNGMYFKNKILNGINCPITKRVFINAGSEPIIEYNP
jgi:hypothetical protein